MRALVQPSMVEPSTSFAGCLAGLTLGSASLFGSFVGFLVFDVADRESEQLGHRGVVGELAAVGDDLAHLVVAALDWVDGVDHRVAGPKSRNG